MPADSYVLVKPGDHDNHDWPWATTEPSRVTAQDK